MSTREGCNNLAKPWLQQRPIVVSETSTVSGTYIEYNAVIEINTAGITLTLKPGAYKGCKLTVIASFATGSATIAFNSQNLIIEADKIYDLIYNGSAWKIHSNESGGGGGGGEDEIPEPTYIINSNDSLTYFMTNGRRGVSSGGNDFTVVCVEEGDFEFTYTSEDVGDGYAGENSLYLCSRAFFDGNNSDIRPTSPWHITVNVPQGLTNFYYCIKKPGYRRNKTELKIIGIRFDFVSTMASQAFICEGTIARNCFVTANMGIIFSSCTEVSDCRADKNSNSEIQNGSLVCFQSVNSCRYTNFWSDSIDTNTNTTVFKSCNNMTHCNSQVGTQDGTIWDAYYCSMIDSGSFRSLYNCDDISYTRLSYAKSCTKLTRTEVSYNANFSYVLENCSNIENCTFVGNIKDCYKIKNCTLGLGVASAITGCRDIENLQINPGFSNRGGAVTFDDCTFLRNIRFDSSYISSFAFNWFGVKYANSRNIDNCLALNVSQPENSFNNCLDVHNCVAYYGGTGGAAAFNATYASHTANNSFAAADTANGGWNLAVDYTTVGVDYKGWM